MDVLVRPVVVGRVYLEDIIGQKVVNVHLTFDPCIARRIGQIGGLEKLLQAVPGFPVAHDDLALSGHVGRLQEISLLDAIVVRQKEAVQALTDLIDPPRLAVDIQQDRLAVGGQSTVLEHQFRRQRIAQVGPVCVRKHGPVLPAVVQHQPLERIHIVPGKERICQPADPVLLAKVEPEPLLAKVPRAVTVDTHAGGHVEP